MELIPILATIILVATISTFILAIGAYILYKIRERQGQQVEVQQPATLQAELLTPELIAEQLQAQEHRRAPGQILFEPVKATLQPGYKPQPEPIFVQQRAQAGPQPVQARNTQSAQPFPQPVRQQAEATQSGDQKFMKYTSDGYVSAKEKVKNQGAVKWR
ncbi:MAG: hypothetical protein M0P61_11470 [Ignavibacteriaceae bacterium]|jgi:hypothetical protein|nr:hypothetical protein [Ignavibacteriaceae bacterium]